MIKPVILLFLIEFCGIYVCSTACSQDNYEIQVYQSELVRQGHTMFELHSNTSLKKASEDRLFSQDYFRETLEITHGFCKWFEIGSYLFTNIGINNSTDIVGVHLRPRFSFPAEFNLPFGLSLSSEFGYVKKLYSADTWTLELRPIIDKSLDHFMFALNTVFSTGLNNRQLQGVEFGSAFKAGYDLSDKVALGLEYYGGYGEITGLFPYSQQQHQLFGVVDLNFGPDWEFNSGFGWSLNKATDRLIIKFIFGRRFGF